MEGRQTPGVPPDGADPVDVFAIYDYLHVPGSPLPAFDEEGRRRQHAAHLPPDTPAARPGEPAAASADVVEPAHANPEPAEQDPAEAEFEDGSSRRAGLLDGEPGTATPESTENETGAAPGTPPPDQGPGAPTQAEQPSPTDPGPDLAGASAHRDPPLAQDPPPTPPPTITDQDRHPPGLARPDFQKPTPFVTWLPVYARCVSMVALGPVGGWLLGGVLGRATFASGPGGWLALNLLLLPLYLAMTGYIVRELDRRWRESATGARWWCSPAQAASRTPSLRAHFALSAYLQANVAWWLGIQMTAGFPLVFALTTGGILLFRIVRAHHEASAIAREIVQGIERIAGEKLEMLVRDGDPGIRIAADRLLNRYIASIRYQPSQAGFESSMVRFPWDDELAVYESLITKVALRTGLPESDVRASIRLALSDARTVVDTALQDATAPVLVVEALHHRARQEWDNTA